MEVEARVPGEPVVDLLFFVGCVVVGNAVDVERFGSAAVDGFEKLEKLLMAMVRHAAPDDLAFQYVERGEQARRAVAFIVMRHGSDPSLLHRQAGLGAVKRLNLALFVDAEHQRVIGWVHIEANHILQLLDKIGIVRQLERLEQMRLQAVGMPDALHRRLADAAGLGHAAATPLRGVRRGALRPGDDLGCFGARQRRETPSARTVVIKRFDTAFGKAPPPIDYGRSRCVEFPGQRVVRLAVRRAENDPGPQRYALLGLAGPDEPFEFLPGLRGYRQCRAARPHAG